MAPKQKGKGDKGRGKGSPARAPNGQAAGEGLRANESAPPGSRAPARDPSPPAPPPAPPPPGPAPIVDRVRHIAGLMANGKWTAKMALELADAWGVSEKTVRHASAEASRRVREALGDPEEIRARLFGVLDEAIELARLDPMPALGAKAMISAVAEFAKLSGVAAPTKVAVTDTKGNDAPSWLQNVDPRLVLAHLAEHGRPPTPGELEALRAQAKSPPSGGEGDGDPEGRAGTER